MHDSIESILKGLLDAMGLSYSGVVRVELAGQTIFNIQTADAREMIGTRGDTLYAIDMLVKKIAEKKNESTDGAEDGGSGLHFLVDVNEYRTKQIKELQTKALMMAERARSFQYDVELNPMSAYERLIIHTTLQDAPNVKTESQGEGRNRRVVIKYSAEART
ncbi:MAG TPA: R3H domain-containing nucleic acid-binding protein [Candidatus Paceibacterota bacterium]